MDRTESIELGKVDALEPRLVCLRLCWIPPHSLEKSIEGPLSVSGSRVPLGLYLRCQEFGSVYLLMLLCLFLGSVCPTCFNGSSGAVWIGEATFHL